MTGFVTGLLETVTVEDTAAEALEEMQAVGCSLAVVDSVEMCDAGGLFDVDAVAAAEGERLPVTVSEKEANEAVPEGVRDGKSLSEAETEGNVEGDSVAEASPVALVVGEGPLEGVTPDGDAAAETELVSVTISDALGDGDSDVENVDDSDSSADCETLGSVDAVGVEKCDTEAHSLAVPESVKNDADEIGDADGHDDDAAEVETDMEVLGEPDTLEHVEAEKVAPPVAVAPLAETNAVPLGDVDGQLLTLGELVCDALAVVESDSNTDPEALGSVEAENVAPPVAVTPLAETTAVTLGDVDGQLLTLGELVCDALTVVESDEQPDADALASAEAERETPPDAVAPLAETTADTLGDVDGQLLTLGDPVKDALAVVDSELSGELDAVLTTVAEAVVAPVVDSRASDVIVGEAAAEAEALPQADGVADTDPSTDVDGLASVDADALVAPETEGKPPRMAPGAHDIQTVDAVPALAAGAAPNGINAAVLLLVTGRIRLAGEANPLNFMQVFLVATEAGTNFIANEMFSLIYG